MGTLGGGVLAKSWKESMTVDPRFMRRSQEVSIKAHLEGVDFRSHI